MKVKRYKKSKKILGFYINNFGFHEPYQVLIDGTFANSAREVCYLTYKLIHCLHLLIRKIINYFIIIAQSSNCRTTCYKVPTLKTRLLLMWDVNNAMNYLSPMHI